MTMMTHCDSIDSPHADIVYLDPDVTALFAEVEAILRAALTESPAPPATGCALASSRPVGRHREVLARHWQAPAHSIRPVQRSPPGPREPATNIGHPQ